MHSAVKVSAAYSCTVATARKNCSLEGNCCWNFCQARKIAVFCVQIIYGDVRNCLLFYSLIPKIKQACRMRRSELRIEMPMEGLGSVISTTCITRNLRL